MTPSSAIIGVDLGASNIRAGRIYDRRVQQHSARALSTTAEAETILQEVIQTIEDVFDSDVRGIGFGAPSVVDETQGIVYDVSNIPAWQEMPIKHKLEQYFRVPVYVNNDANCFVLGEKYFGKGQPYRHLVGVTLGTGIGVGVVINHQLYSGANCGVGEFGIAPYRDRNYDEYCGGLFFDIQYQIDGKVLFERAQQGNQQALDIFGEYGWHLGNALWMLLSAYDPEIIILGGSIRRAYPFFQDALWRRLSDFPYQRALKRLRLELTEEPRIAILGAAALCYQGERE